MHTSTTGSPISASADRPTWGLSTSAGLAPKRPFATVGSLIVCGVLLWMVGAVVYPVYLGARGKAPIAICTSNQKQIASALLQYASDFDGHLPLGKRWIDQTLPYTRNDNVYHCPSADGLPYGFAYNHGASEQIISKIESPSALVTTYDSAAGWRNATDNRTSLPKPGRHNGGNIFSYADGHAHWMLDKSATNAAVIHAGSP